MRPTSASSFSSSTTSCSLALKARFGKTGRLTRRRCEMRVAPAALAAAAEDERLGVGHILDDLVRFRVAHDGAARHADREILALLAELARALTVHAVVGDVFALVAKVHQRGHVVVDNEDDVAAVAAVAAVGAARGDVLFAVERHRAIAALARAAEDARLINKRCCHVGTSPWILVIPKQLVYPFFGDSSRKTECF